MSKKKKKGAEESSGSSMEWLLTFSDVLTLMITFFVLLISMSSMDSKQLKETASFFRGALGNLEASKGRSSNEILSKKQNNPRPNPLLIKINTKNDGVSEQEADPSQLDAVLRQATVLKQKLKKRSLFPTTKGMHELDANAVDLFATARPVKLVRAEGGGHVSLHVGLIFPYGEAKLRPEVLNWLRSIGKTIDGSIDRIDMPVRESGNRALNAPPWLLAAWRSAAMVKILGKNEAAAGIIQISKEKRSFAKIVWAKEKKK